MMEQLPLLYQQLACPLCALPEAGLSALPAVGLSALTLRGQCCKSEKHMDSLDNHKMSM